MKRFFAFFMLCFCTVTAGAVAPHGISFDAVDDHTFGIDLFLQENPTITYTALGEFTPAQKTIFTNNLQKWPRETLQFIQQSEREKEFKDILPFFTRELTIQEVPFYEPAHVMLTWDKKNRRQEQVSGYFAHTMQTNDITFAPTVFVSPDETGRFDEVTLHELGHFYGLADDYFSGRRNAHPEYSGEVNESYGSIMQEIGTHDAHLTCDDADGFIKLVDLRLSQQNNGKFTGRARKGWKSLCPGSAHRYKNGLTVNRNEYDGNADGTILRYKKGKLVETGTPIFSQKNVFDIFGVSEQDTVITDKTTGRVRAITSPLEMYFLDKEDNARKTTVTLSRTFNYRPHAPNEYWIDVRREINGAVEREMRFLVTPEKVIHIENNYADGVNTFTAAHYKSSGLSPSYEYGNFTADITLNNFQPVSAEITIAGHGQYRNGKLRVQKEGESWKGLLRIEDKDRNVAGYHVVLTPQLRYDEKMQRAHVTILKLLERVFSDNVSYIRDFYERFYQPLMGTEKTELQVQKILQEKLSGKK